MFTICPKCSLKLLVTAADLRIAQGFVRCGRCSNVFNALAGLSDEQQATFAQAPEASEPTRERPRPERRPSERPQAPAAPPEHAETALEFDPSSTDVSSVFVQAPIEGPEQTGTFESIILSTEDAPEGTEPEVHEFGQEDLPPSAAEATPTTITPAPPPGTPQSANPPGASADSGPHVGATAPQPAASRGTGPQAPQPQIFSISDDPEAGGHESGTSARSLEPRALAGVVVALAVLLLAQALHHYRVELAELGAPGRALAALYAGLGMPLTPHWSLAAYEVRQLGAVAGAPRPGTLTVRASIKNNAPRPQPLPLLRVTVQDRFGNRVAARDVAPQAYLPHGASSAQLAPGQRIDAEIAFADPGPNAEGFELDACLDRRGGGIACANEASP